MTAVALDYPHVMHPETPRDRLTVTFFLALVVHVLVIWWVGFDFETPSPRTNTTMEIILVQTRSDTEPEEADFLAQANQQGGGTVEEQVHSTTVTPAPFPDTEIHPASADAPPEIAAPEPPPEEEELVVSEPEAEPVAPPPPQEIVPESPPDTGDASHTQVARPQPTALDLIMDARRTLTNIETTLDDENQQFDRRPRSKYVGADTKEYRFANYMESWRRKIEHIGTLNFPDEARRKNLSGDVLLDVTINADGTIGDIEIMEPSEHQILNDAAIQIVRLAQPFAPFSEDIRKDFDILHITSRIALLSDGRLAGSWQ